VTTRGQRCRRGAQGQSGAYLEQDHAVPPSVYYQKRKLEIASFYAFGKILIVIESFADKLTENIWRGQETKKLPRALQEDARDVLRILNNIKAITDLSSMPGLRSHKLVGNRKGLWSVRVNAQWRLTFFWDEDRKVLTRVCFEDYH
jgi:proteic killer suppression protein